MSMNDTVSAERLHIAFFGKRNAGKSSLVNAVTNQSISVVSDVSGTTTDPVKKTMELLPIGPVVIIDTPGFDDLGKLGDLRVKKTYDILAKTDIAIFVTTSDKLDTDENDFLELIKQRKKPYIIVQSKADLVNYKNSINGNAIKVSSLNKKGIEDLKNAIGKLAKTTKNEKKIVSDLLNAGDLAVLVTPIDSSAPKGRLILPQQQTLRDLLDAGCTAAVCQPSELEQTLNNFKTPPKIIITDSQAFGKVSKIVPNNIHLTSFSILFARYKGNLLTQIKGASMLSKLCDGDKVLIAEGCTHHRQCGDIGTVKLPAWIKKFSGSSPDFTFTSGGEFPKDLTQYKLIVHCGGCMLNETEMKYRTELSVLSNVPMVNYGVAIAHMNGILQRSLEIFPDALKALNL
ncbi:MAG: [FeFe] hydrogenase H-cluster maturation GTPase HydF [Clostridia bacterium]|nr:[FeFe] hydrogenase H-cluster maturation GTPase HydF [Clostridia bacterium]